jgi:hypothetical protein
MSVPRAVPGDFCEEFTIPLIKSGDFNSVDMYRDVTIVLVISKVLVLYTLPRLTTV